MQDRTKSVKKTLGDFELYVMLAIARLGQRAYGGAIRREIENRTERTVAIGALYATVERLGDKGLLDFRIEHPATGRPGRARKYCRLTADGEETLRYSVEMLRRLMQDVHVGGLPLAGSAVD